MNRKVFTLVLTIALLFGGLANAQKTSFNQGIEKAKKESKVTATETVGHSVYSNGHSAPSPFLNAPKSTEGVLYEQHELVNNPGAGVGATDLSELEATQDSWGSGCQKVETNSLADDFIVPVGETWQITGFVFYAYQSFAGTTSTFNGAYAKVYGEDPSTGATPIGEYWADNIMVSTEWINVYRVSDGELTNTDRAIMSITCELPTTLEASEGTYWVEWTLTGTSSSGPWVPHLQRLDGTLETGNAMQYASGAWTTTIEDPTGSAQGMPFDVLGTSTEPTAPAACVDFTVTPAGLGVLTYDVSWTNPSLDFEGNALSEITAVALYVDGVEVTGQTWNLGITAANSASGLAITTGNHTVSVRAINTAGNGSLVSQTLWFGEDVSGAPTDVVLSATDMDASLVWVAPIVGQNGEYFSGTGLTYDVVRYPGAILVSDDQTELTFTETLTTAGIYTYKVIASNASGEGDSEMSNSLIIGDFLLYEDFETWPLADWSYITVGAGWVETDIQVHSGTKSVYHNDDNGANTDWLISPAVNLVESGDLVFWEYQNWYTYYELHKVSVLDGPDPATATELGVLYSEVGIEDTWVEKTFSLDLYAGQTVYFGFYYEGDNADEWYLDDITVVGRAPLANYDVTFNIADGDAVNLNAEVTVYSGATEMFNGVAVDGTITFADVIEGNYTYDVELVGYFSQTGVALTVDGEEIVDVVLVLDLTSVSEVINVNSIAYPNPSTGLYTVAVDGQYEAKIYDVTGKLVYASTLTSTNNTIDLSAQDAGVYFIQLNGENTINFRVIKN